MRRLNGFNVDTAWKCWVLKDDHHKVVDGRTVTGLHNRTDTSIEGGWRYISKTLMTITMTIMMVMMVMTIMIMIMRVCQHTGPWQTWASPWVQKTRRRRSLVTQITSHSARPRYALSNQWKDVRNEPRWRLTRSPSSILPALQASLATGPESWWALNRIKPPKCAQVSKLSKKGEGGRAASIEVHGAVGKSVASSPMVRWGTDRWGGRHQVWSS